jgi:DNA-directed RNA polymerase subunit F
MNLAKMFCLAAFWLSLLLCVGCPPPQPRTDVVLSHGTMTMALVSDPDKTGEPEDRDIVFDTVHGVLAQQFDIVNPEALAAAIQAEARVTGQSSIDDPAAYEKKKFNAVDVMAYFWVTTASSKEEDGTNVWYATIGTHGVRRQTGEELWRFQLRSGEKRASEKRPAQVVYATSIGDREARSRAIKNLAFAVAEDILERIGNRQADVSESTQDSYVYVVKFIAFNNDQTEKIREAMSDLETQKCLKIRPGGSSVGAEYVTYKIKWLHTGDDQLKVINVIRDACANNEVTVTCNENNPGIIVFRRK